MAASHRPANGDEQRSGRRDDRDRGGQDPFQVTSNRTPQPSPWLGVVVWLLVGLAVFYGYQRWQDGRIPEIAYTEFEQQVEAGRVVSVTVEGRHVIGERRTREAGAGDAEANDAEANEAGGAGEEAEARGAGADGAGAEGAAAEAGAEPEQFQTHVPVFVDGELMALLKDNGVTIEAEEAGPQWWSRLLIGFLPWLVILAVLFFVFRRMRDQMSGAQSGMFSMGKSRMKRVSADEPEATFDDVAGAENAKRDLKEITDYLRRPGTYRRLGAQVPRGVLMVGPPGTGKTLLARAVAGEAQVPFFSISGSEFIEMFVGVGASRVRDMFEKARKEAPAIVFVDELDAIGRSRGTGVGGGHDEREQTLNQILSEMDGFSPGETVVVMAATNRPDVLDPALLRPGRFDRKITLDMPHKDARHGILEVHTRDIPLADDVDLEAVARRCVGLSGAELENLANEAALFAGREGTDRVHMRHFESARDRIQLGAPREQRIDDEERRVIAYHESGHALTALLFPKADRLEKLTIIPRGQALGATMQSPEEGRFNMTASYARDRIAVMLGGRVAEKLVFGEVSSGAENDIDQATRLARRMVSRWGMSEKVGPVSFSSTQDEVFLGKEIARERDFSDESARLIDAEVQKLIRDVEQEVERRLGEARHRLDALAEAVLEQETLEAEEIDHVLERVGSDGDDPPAREAPQTATEDERERSAG